MQQDTSFLVSAMLGKSKELNLYNDGGEYMRSVSPLLPATLEPWRTPILFHDPPSCNKRPRKLPIKNPNTGYEMGA